jgi:ATP-dependent RNA helicase SUPV3L1/SUV3
MSATLPNVSSSRYDAAVRAPASPDLNEPSIRQRFYGKRSQRSLGVPVSRTSLQPLSGFSLRIAPMRSAIAVSSPVVAALGPTNTGKTHRAVERMLEYRTGMIGLPLRLLAREVYDRITARIGEQQVALITGEEKRIPRRPRYWVCTTEAMPVDRAVEFVAVDEIQLAAHPQRGHVFTDRLLHARGTLETWFMGADTMRPLLEQLVPTADFQRQPRLSRLASQGRLALKSLPPRTAVVGFSSSQIYDLAERLRRRRGGTAVVLGALSPRTRNAQVAMYQSGEVQYLVATDAIGMGLNMDVDLVAFASIRKFDGARERMLDPAELAQIAGRAGRNLNDGSFATIAPLPPLPSQVVFALENHLFTPVRRVFWRNSDLDLSSLDALVASLGKRPGRGVLQLVERAEDSAALLALVREPEVHALAQTPERVALLWEVCQVPDFRQLLLESHTRLLGELFVQLCRRPGVLDNDWMARRVYRIDDVQGDIDALLMRIAFIRTWTYVANHRSWVADAEHWRQTTRDIEDRLSDALHERLVQQFVARARTVAAGRIPRRAPHPTTQTAPVARHISQHHPFRALASLRVPTGPLRLQDIPTVDEWLEDAVQATHERFSVDVRGRVSLDGEFIARMTRGVDLLRPDAVVTVDDDLGAGARLRLQRRVLAFVRDRVEALLAPLRHGPTQGLSPAARGVVYRLEQGLGTFWTRDAREQLGALTAPDRAALRALRVTLGARVVFVPELLRPAAIVDRAALCTTFFELTALPALPCPGSASVLRDPHYEQALYMAIGHPVFGGRAIRADVVERLHALLARCATRGAFQQPVEVAHWLGCTAVEASEAIVAFGYAVDAEGGFRRLHPRQRRRLSLR